MLNLKSFPQPLHRTRKLIIVKTVIKFIISCAIALISFMLGELVFLPMHVDYHTSYVFIDPLVFGRIFYFSIALVIYNLKKVLPFYLSFTCLFSATLFSCKTELFKHNSIRLRKLFIPYYTCMTYVFLKKDSLPTITIGIRSCRCYLRDRFLRTLNLPGSQLR